MKTQLAHKSLTGFIRINVGKWTFASIKPFGCDPVRICCEVISNTIEISRKHRVFDLYLYTDGGVYFSPIETVSLNRQLNWDAKFFSMLKDCLNGKNKNIVIEFSHTDLKLKISCDFQGSSIRILFFEVQLTEIHQPPMRHAQMLLKNIDHKNRQTLNVLEVKCKTVEHEIEKASQLMRQMKDMQQFEVEHIKNKYLPIINEAKAKLRPHFNPSLSKPSKPESEDSQQSSTRKLYKIKRGSSSNMKVADFQKLFE